MLNILSLARWDWAGCGYFLSEAINATTQHHSRAVVFEPSETLQFPYDLKGLTYQRLGLLWDWADVVHIHDEPGWMPRGIVPKPTVVTYHGSRYRQNPYGYNAMLRRKGWLGTVSTRDLTKWGLSWLPDTRPDLSAYYDPPDRFTVAHAPSQRVRKGTQRVIDACAHLGVPLVLVEDKPWRECIEEKGRAHVLVDQFTYGHGCNGVEAWATGQAVVGDGPDEILALFGEQLPFTLPRPSLAEALARMRNDSANIEAGARLGQAYYRHHHSYEEVAGVAAQYYHQAIERFDADKTQIPDGEQVKVPKRPRQPVLDYSLVAIRYLPDRVGKMTWTPDGDSATGTRYVFSYKQRERYVYEPDVLWFLGLENKRGGPLFEMIDEVQAEV